MPEPGEEPGRPTTTCLPCLADRSLSGATGATNTFGLAVVREIGRLKETSCVGNTGPSSSVFVVWQQAREGNAEDGVFRFGRDFGGTLAAQGKNVFLVELVYWLNY